MSSTASGPRRHRRPRPRPQPTPRERILSANVYISTLQFIAALLLTLMLLWHISTLTLVEDYEMPDWWERDFIAELRRGWRILVWVLVLFMVPIDCVHALLSLDWWCLLLHDREDGYETAEKAVSDEEKEAVRISVHKDIYDRSRNRLDRTPDASTMSRLFSNTLPSSATKIPSTPSRRPYTYHPLLHQRISNRTQVMLLSILDLTMLAILASHIVSYILSLPRYLEHCKGSKVDSAPLLEFGGAKVPLNVRDSCIKLNVDIHVAGGFSTFMTIVLGLLHIATLLVRVWGGIELGKDGVVGKAFAEDGPTANCESKHDTASKDPDPNHCAVLASSIPSSHPRDKASGQSNYTASTTSLRNSRSISAEERSTGVRFVDSSAERTEYGARRRARGTDTSEVSEEGLEEGSKWGEVLLECLTDA